MALSAGYFFKCPLCNNTDQFRKCMRQKGIYVPDRDASWELEQNAYNELHAPSYSCEAKVCLSKKGRSFNAVHGFAFMSCSSCGAGSIHSKCCLTAEFVCQICTELFKGRETEETMSNSVLQNMIEAADTENNNTETLTTTVDGEEDAPDEANASILRRSIRTTARPQETPDKGSPFKMRNAAHEGLGTTPKRRRLM